MTDVAAAPNNASKTRFRILALDGGGLRGIFAAHVLAKLEEQLDSKIADHFDLITGTSTGAILGLGLAAGISAAAIARFYEEHRTSIFGRPRSKAAQFLWGGHKHDPTPLYDSLKGVLGERTLGDLATRVCIPTVSAHDGTIRVLKTPHLKRYVTDKGLLLWKVAAASAAAPTFLPPASLERIEDGYLDGGLWANHPGLVGMIEANMLDVPMGSVEMLSIGTGDGIVSHDVQQMKSWRLGTWAVNVVDLTIAAQQQLTAHLIRILRARVYERINFKLPDDLRRMDDVERCTRIIPLAIDEHRRGSAKLAAFCDTKVENWKERVA